MSDYMDAFEVRRKIQEFLRNDLGAELGDSGTDLVPPYKSTVCASLAGLSILVRVEPRDN